MILYAAQYPYGANEYITSALFTREEAAKEYLRNSSPLKRKDGRKLRIVRLAFFETRFGGQVASVPHFGGHQMEVVE